MNINTNRKVVLSKDKRKMKLVKSLDDRIKFYREVKNYIYTLDSNNIKINANGIILCPKFERVLENISIRYKIGTPSVNGEVVQACVIDDHQPRPMNILPECKVDTYDLTIKKMPADESDVSLWENHKALLIYDNNRQMVLNKAMLSNEKYVEIICLKLCRYLALNKISPHFPILMNYFACDDCSFENDELKKRTPTNDKGKFSCFMLLNEYASGGDVKNWALKEPHPYEEWLNMYFQVFSGLFVLQAYFDMTHHDLHWGNVLVYETETTPGYYHYIIGKDDPANNKRQANFYIPNMGKTFVLWDFGFAKIPKKLQAKPNSYYEDQEKEGVRRLACDYFRFSHVPSWVKTYYDGPKIDVQKEGFEKLKAVIYEKGVELNNKLTYYVTNHPNYKTIPQYIKIKDNFDFLKDYYDTADYKKMPKTIDECKIKFKYLLDNKALEAIYLDIQTKLNKVNEDIQKKPPLPPIPDGMEDFMDKVRIGATGHLALSDMMLPLFNEFTRRDPNLPILEVYDLNPRDLVMPEKYKAFTTPSSRIGDAISLAVHTQYKMDELYALDVPTTN